MSAVPVAAVASDRARVRLWRDVAGLIREMLRAHPVAGVASLVLLLLGNARTGLYVAAMGGIVDALISGRSVLPWVLVLSGGRVAEAGTHEELLRVGGEYATMFRAQARWYE